MARWYQPMVDREHQTVSPKIVAGATTGPWLWSAPAQTRTTGSNTMLLPAFGAASKRFASLQVSIEPGPRCCGLERPSPWRTGSIGRARRARASSSPNCPCARRMAYPIRRQRGPGQCWTCREANLLLLRQRRGATCVRSSCTGLGGCTPQPWPVVHRQRSSGNGLMLPVHHRLIPSSHEAAAAELVLVKPAAGNQAADNRRGLRHCETDCVSLPMPSNSSSLRVRL